MRSHAVMLFKSIEPSLLHHCYPLLPTHETRSDFRAMNRTMRLINANGLNSNSLNRIVSEVEWIPAVYTCHVHCNSGITGYTHGTGEHNVVYIMSLFHGHFVQLSLTFFMDWETLQAYVQVQPVQEEKRGHYRLFIKSGWFKTNVSLRMVGAAKQTTIEC